ncbi:hypothetical protein COJ46_18120 [Bacillus sp. AFS077874]|uniref:hypothetical protein n=1 Tax=unclassified Bacillus (in: firmicutes) TaxID=185979 RepID=UPI000BEC8863|nr:MULTISPECIES: hypothetical protein [unclassified Bacillus (in: firmicutes)]PEC50251.1 hypothetical protein CON00_07200 [Bacillus sp. AFS096315]PFM77796.1 hypothetical protein COJ46_18120 [Bacillus sp. AFS077874]
MAQYAGLFFSLAIIILVVMLNKVLFWWVKSLIVMYYFVISLVFIKVKNNMDEQYVTNYKVSPLPSVSNDYWDKNSDWVGATTLWLFIPVIIIVSFVHYKQFKKAENKGAKLFVFLRLLFLVFLFFILGFMFNLAYGMSP